MVEEEIDAPETNYRESKESPNPGEYGLWFLGQNLDTSKNLKKSFLNCDAIPFSGSAQISRKIQKLTYDSEIEIFEIPTILRPSQFVCILGQDYLQL